MIKSPFLVFEKFLSPKQCEQIIDQLGFYSYDVDSTGNPIKMYKYKEISERIVYDRLQDIINQIQHYFSFNYRATETIQFECFSPGIEPDPICENSNYIRKKWTRVKDRDITGVVFLNDYNDQVPFDPDYECYGGKLEFPQHNFGFNPQRGTAVFYPSGPHFINANSLIQAGELIQGRIHIAAQLPYLYDPSKFPGDYTTWFNTDV